LLGCVALDPEGPYGELVDALALIDITEESEQIIGVGARLQADERDQDDRTQARERDSLARQICADGLVRRAT
jgi:hypothetical protein